MYGGASVWTAPWTARKIAREIQKGREEKGGDRVSVEFVRIPGANHMVCMKSLTSGSRYLRDLPLGGMGRAYEIRACSCGMLRPKYPELRQSVMRRKSALYSFTP